MSRNMGTKGLAQLTSWIDNGREACAERIVETPYVYLNTAPSLPTGNNKLVVLRKVPAAG